MKLISLLLVAGSISALGATEEQLNKRFTVQPGGRLVVDVDFGSININTNSSNEVTADVWRKISRSDKDAELTYLKETPVEFVQDGPNVTIRSHSKTRVSNINWFGRFRSDAKYTITVPQQFALQLKTAGGGITAKNVHGETKAETSGGSLDFAGMQGSLRGETSGGGIQVDSCQGKLWIHTSGGSIKVNGGSGSIEGETSAGSVSVKDFNGPARVGTSGGGITINKVNGEVNGNTSGGSIHAELISPIPGPVKLETSGGSITIRAPGDAAFELDASTSAGGVHTEFPVTTRDVGRQQIRGTVNGGGKTVFLRTSAGSINVQKN